VKVRSLKLAEAELDDQLNNPKNRSWTHPSVRLAHCLARRDEAHGIPCNEEQRQPDSVPGVQSGT